MASTSSEARPPSSPSETPTVNNSTKAKSKSCSIRNLVANFKAKFFVSKPKPLDNNHHNAASSSTATTNKNDDDSGALSLSSKMIRNHLLLLDSAFAEAKKYMDHGGALFLSSNMIRNNLLLVDYSAALAEAKKYIDHLNVKINKGREKFEELQTLGGSLRDFDELRKDVTKLRLQISSHVKIRPADSNPHRKRWPNINEAEDGMMHFFYKEPQVTYTCDFDHRILKAFHDLPEPLQCCLLCFFKFPREATIKKATMIYLWIGQGFICDLWGREEYPQPEEDAGKKIFDELIAKSFIEPVYNNKYSLVPDSCRMSLSVRSSLYVQAEKREFTSNTLDLNLEFLCAGQFRHSCLINVGEAIINYEPKIFKNMKNIRSLYLGRWQRSPTHHIELANAKILHGLKKLKSLTFLSLRGISMITELPTFIVELNDLKILDLRACHNLETIPNNIGLLKKLTHLDMSECYFLEHMPKSLAQLSNLEVLKGFFIGDIEKQRSCTLEDLFSLSKLRKLDICTGLKEFLMESFNFLQRFEGLQKLTISWRGCPLHVDTLSKLKASTMSTQEKLRVLLYVHKAVSKFLETIVIRSKIQKIDLQCFPGTTLSNLLIRHDPLKELKKLYIRGGPLSDLGQIQKHQGEQWNVEILRLNNLSELEIDWSELRILFPKLIYLHQVDCPKLTNFPCDENGVWMNMEAIDTHVQLKKYLKTGGMISSSSMWGSGSTSAQDDCNISLVDEKPH